MRSITAFTLLAVTLWTGGCGDDKYKFSDQSSVVVRNEMADSGSVIIGPDTGTVVTEADAQKRRDENRPAGTDPEEIRILKMDLYYKFEWAKRVLVSKVIPEDLQMVVDDVRTRSSKLPSDRVSFIVKDITELLQQGLDANKLDAKEKAANAQQGSPVPTRRVLEHKVKTATKHVTWTPGHRKLPEEQREGRLTAEADMKGQNMEKLTWDKFKQASAKTDELAQMLGVIQDSTTPLPSPTSSTVTSPNAPTNP
ncbi:MAG: hypothetical protein ABJA67_17320 [Chthonomonadales bacterium]